MNRRRRGSGVGRRGANGGGEEKEVVCGGT